MIGRFSEQVKHVGLHPMVSERNYFQYSRSVRSIPIYSDGFNHHQLNNRV